MSKHVEASAEQRHPKSEELDILKRTHDTESWLKQHLGARKRDRNSLSILCPVCYKPAVWNHRERLFFCFACRSGGDVIRIFQLFYREPFLDIVYKRLQYDDRTYEYAKAHRGRNTKPRRVRCSDGREFDSVRAASLHYGMSYATITRNLEGAKSKVTDLRFEYIEDPKETDHGQKDQPSDSQGD
jgi:hypothetical protein